MWTPTKDQGGERKNTLLYTTSAWTKALWSSGTNLVFLGLVRRGHVSQILDDLLGVFCLSGSRFAPEHTDKHEWDIKHRFHGQIIIREDMQDHVTHVQRMDWSSRSVGGEERIIYTVQTHSLSTFASFLSFYVFWVKHFMYFEWNTDFCALCILEFTILLIV